MNNKVLVFILSLFGFIGLTIIAVTLMTYLKDPVNTYKNDIQIFIVIGIVCFTIAAIPFLSWARSIEHKHKLLRYGVPIQAKITKIDYSSAIVVNGKCPFIIYCQWQDPSDQDNIYTFFSESIWFDPKPFITNKTITVYIDPKNPQHYYVAIDFLSSS